MTEESRVAAQAAGRTEDFSLRTTTTQEFASLASGPEPFVILLPVGSVEPHGPHLGLLTDTVISDASSRIAAGRLIRQRIPARIAPAVAYGVTEFAAGFAGAVSVAPAALIAYLKAVVQGFLDNRVAHVCLVNNHLEPGHYQALLDVAAGFVTGTCSVACPLARRWARTLSEEFKRGECHAGRYETALILAADPGSVNEYYMRGLPEVPISLSQGIKAGVRSFKALGMTEAYAGAPAQATAEEGYDLLQKLATMIETEVVEALRAGGRLGAS